ncbi:hypothetical protein DASC09_024320 [Saccharomycopsis crataegensis]|uniref:Formamidopyrimidine-DNA glycosylase catalytic domain-containing protein n=1 Tax=Saccharomycopsis crataegensis TaxID=43959 RepID=A0AAV5QKL8_9ASCO|nr:hypothetical protein DASC09_024320 [Saccharomycopsis crataegensis]
MPEVGEVAHAVANLRRNILGYTIKSASFLLDDKIFPSLKEDDPKKKSTSTKSPYFYQPELKFKSPSDIENSLKNKKIVGIGRHGKYFWIRTKHELNEEGQNLYPNGLLILLHFGMTGWIKFKDIYSHFIQMESGGYKKVFKILGTDENGDPLPKQEDENDGETRTSIDKDVIQAEDWPPRFHKFLLNLSEGAENNIDLGFVDPRRLAKVRFYEINSKLNTDELVLQNIEQLSKLGPDYSKTNSKNTSIIEDIEFVSGDPDPHDHAKSILSQGEFKDLVLSKPKLTIKPFLLKQEYFSGVGNWMADEILFHSKIYPEEVLGSLDEEDIELLYEKLIEISKISVDLEAEVAKFPRSWLMLYRWGKKSKKTYHGHDVKFVTVGGRTSCYVAEIQKKKSKKRKKEVIEEEEEVKSESNDDHVTVKKTTTRAKRKKSV